MRSQGQLNIPLTELICSLLPHAIFFCPSSKMSFTHWVITFMSVLQQLIRNEDLTACLMQGKEQYTCIAYADVAVVSLLPTIEALWCMCCMFVFKHIDRRFPSNCLFIQMVIPTICFLKLFVYTCQISCSNAAVPCVDSAQWRLPQRSMTGCFAVSCSVQCVFLIQHLWVVSWLVSPETWMRVRLDLSWRETFPPGRLFSQWSHPCWQGVLLGSRPEGVAFCYSLHCCLYLTRRCHCVSSICYKTYMLHTTSPLQLMCASPCKRRCCFRTWPWYYFAWGWWASSFPGFWSPSCHWGCFSASSEMSPGQVTITTLRARW